MTVTVQAAMINTALRVAAEYYAFHPDTDAPAYQAAIRDALTVAVHGFCPNNEQTCSTHPA